MNASVWLLLGSLFYTLQLRSGSFPKPLTEEEERHYLALSAQGDLEARNILVERNLRLVAHVMNKGYCARKLSVADKRHDFVRILWQNRENPLECSADVSKDKPGR